MESHTHAALVHGEYLIEPATRDAEGALPLLVGFHGYGETARHHVEELKKIPGIEGWTLCGVQALHPFYKRSSGEVVRSWMTKEHRHLAMEDNIRYVISVVAEVRRRFGADRRLVFSGFSQGAAMAWRAAIRCGLPCDGLIVLAGDVPSEVVDWSGGSVPPVLLGRGTQDAWYSTAKMEADLTTLKTLKADVTTCVFEAGHVWHDDFYQAAGRFLAARA